MRGADITQAALFSYRTLEQRIPKNHPLRKFRVVVDAILASMDAELDALYAPTGRDSIPPERLLHEHGVRSSIVAIRNPWLRMRLAHMVRAIVVMRIMHQHLI